MAININFEDVRVGDTMPAWSRKTDFMNWNRYAAVNDEFIPIHMDDEAGARPPMPRARSEWETCALPIWSTRSPTGSATKPRSARWTASSAPSIRRMIC